MAPLSPFVNATGDIPDLSQFRGSVVLLNFWATWCPPCVRELPSLDRLQAELGSDKFMVLALSIDANGRNVVQPIFKQLRLTHLGVYLVPGGVTDAAFMAHGLRSVPTSFLIDRTGRVVGYLSGAADWASPAAMGLIQYYIARRGAA